MRMIFNTEYKPHQDLGHSDADWAALKTKIIDYLKTQASKSTVSIADVRAIDPKLADDRVWNQIAGDLGLQEIPGSDG